MKKFIVIATIVLLSSCSAKLLMPSQTDAERGSATFKGLTVEDLNKGKDVFDKKCTQCHGHKRPASWTEIQWRRIIPAMAEKAYKSNKIQISSTEQEQVLRYLVTMGQHAKKN
jgi:uncharacterized membrane protein